MNKKKKMLSIMMIAFAICTGGCNSTVKENATKVEATTTVEETTTRQEETTTVEETTSKEEATTTVEETTPKEEATTTVEETTPKEEATTTVEETTTKEKATTTVEETTTKEKATTTVEETTTREEETTTVEETTSKEEATTTVEETTTKEEETNTIEESTTDIEEETRITLGEELNEKLQDKQYDSLQKEYILSIYNKISQNYDSYYNLFEMADIPDKDTYIRTHLINPLNNIGSFRLIDFNSDEAQKELNSGSSVAWFTKNSLGENEVVLLYRDIDDDSEYLYHEISHAQNVKCINNEKFYCFNGEFNRFVFDIYIEGHATFHQLFVNDLYNCHSGFWTISNSVNNTIFYGKNNGKGYLQYFNIYANLLLIVGYDVMEEVSLTADMTIFIDSLEKQYGKDISNRILTNIKYLTLKNIDKDVRYNSCVEFQNAILDALCIKLDKLNTKEDIEEFIRFYKIYQYYLQPRAFESSDQYNSNEITYDVFDISKLEDKLIEKILEFEIIKGEYAKVTAKAILFSSIVFYPIRDMDTYKSISLPIIYDDIVVNSVSFKDNRYYVNINYTDILYKRINLNVDMEYVLDENYNIINIYNTYNTFLPY